MPKPNQKVFHVSVKVIGEFDVVVTAESLEDALAKIRAMKAHEQIDAMDSWNDYETSLNGIWMES